MPARDSNWSFQELAADVASQRRVKLTQAWGHGVGREVGGILDVSGGEEGLDCGCGFH
jgi:hypothetical protein